MPVTITNADLSIVPINLSIQLATPYETLVSPSVELPTSEPSNYTYTFTATSSYFPTLSSTPSSLFTYPNICQTTPVVQNTSGATRTIYMKLYVNNNLLINTNTSLSTGSYLTWNSFIYDVKVDDVIQVKLWASGATTYFVYYNGCIYPTRIVPTLFNGTVCQIDFNSISTYPNFSLGNSSVVSTRAIYVYSGSLNVQQISSTTSYPALYSGSNTFYRLASGDYINADTSTSVSNATYYPLYYRNYVPTNITYRFIGR